MRKIYAFLGLCFLTLSVSAQTYHNGTWYSYYDESGFVIETKITSISGESHEISSGIFSPTAQQLIFKWKYTSIGWGGILANNSTTFYQSANSGSNTKAITTLTDKAFDVEHTENLPIDVNVNWLKCDRPTGNTHKFTATNIAIPLAKHILLAEGEYGKTTDSHEFGEIEINQVSEAYMVNLRSFLTDGDITITSSDPQNFRIGDATNTEGLYYEVGANACASVNGTATEAQGGTLGNIANYAFPIYFTPQKGGEFEATITITDGTSTATVSVTGVAPKQAQTITWNEEQESLLTSGSIATAEVSSGLEVEYTFAPEGVVTYTDGAFQILSAGVVKITAAQSGNDFYYPAIPIAKTFTIYPTETGYAYVASICEGSFYTDDNFENLTEAGVYTDTLKTTYGADSIITFTLTLNPLFHSEEEMAYTIGEQHTWQGIDLSEFEVGDTTLVKEYQSIYGCDSTYTLHLTVKPLIITYGADTIHACSGETVIYEGKAYKQSATDSIVLPGQNYAGGDSIVVLVVSFSQSFSAETYLTITEGDEETWQGNDLSEIAVGDTALVAEYQTVYGCDSVYILYLTVEENNKEALPFTEADQIGVQKIMKDGMLYIRKGEELFDIRGRKVKSEK